MVAHTISLLGRAVPVVQTPDGPRAVVQDRPVSPAGVERYLRQKFGPALSEVEAALRDLAAAYPPRRLATIGFTWYEEFRPGIPEGVSIALGAHAAIRDLPRVHAGQRHASPRAALFLERPMAAPSVVPIPGRPRSLARLAQFIGFVFWLLYSLLFIRLLLVFFAASSWAGFVRFVDTLTNPFYGPFRGIVANQTVAGEYTLAVPLLIAIVVYALLHLVISKLLRLIAYRATSV